MTLKCNTDEYILFDAEPFVESWWNKTTRRMHTTNKPKHEGAEDIQEDEVEEISENAVDFLNRKYFG